MDGMLGPLLTDGEWARIGNVASRVTHIVYWMNTTIQDLRREGYLDDLSAQSLGDELNKLRGSDDGDPVSMPWRGWFTSNL